jgi:hypothetical protein
VAADRLAPTAAAPAAVTGKVERSTVVGPVICSRSSSAARPPSARQTAGSGSVMVAACHYFGRVRLTYFRELMEGEFGAARAASVSRDHVFAELGGRTVEQALEAGIDAREVWLAVCNAYDVPASRR